MTASASYIEWLIEILSPIGHVAVKRMFGGAGVYCDGVMFAIIADDQLYLKTDEAGQAAFAAGGSGPFTYDTKNGPGQLKSYWKAPEHLADDSDAMIGWARRAVAIARSAFASKSAPQRTTKKRGSMPRA